MAPEEVWLTAAFAVVFVTLCCIGTVLNVLLLVVFTRHPETRTPENILLINLCVSDIAYFLSFFAFTLECHVFVISRGFTTAINTYSVAAISVQRYVGLVTYRIRLPTDKTDYVYSYLILAGVWIVAIVVTAVELFLIIKGKDDFCRNYFKKGVCVYRLFMHGVIPSAIISVFYITAARRVNRTALHLPGVECKELQTLPEQRKKSARILFALAVVFVMTYIPVVLFTTLFTMSTQVSYWRMLTVFTAILMSTLNPIFNHIALYIASRQLRVFYHKYCCCCCCQTTTAQTTSTVAQNKNATAEEVEV